MSVSVKKRTFILGLSIFILIVTGWVTILFQRNQHLVGGGINRAFLFLLINAHLIASIVLLYLIIRQSMRLVVERRQKVPGSYFKRNLLLSFIVFSVIPVVFLFVMAGKLITTSIDTWFESRIGTGLYNSFLLHEEQTKKERSEISQASLSVQEKLKEFSIDKLRKDPEFSKYSIYLWRANGEEGDGSIRDEVHVWRKFRKLNDRSTKTLRKSFFKLFNSNKSSRRPFDFYGSLYLVDSIFLDGDNNFDLVLAYRYPSHIRYPLIEVQNAIDDYSQLQSIRGPIYWNYFLTFLLITLLILFLSIWCAFFLARGISQPIKELLLAVKKIRKGDLDVEVSLEPTHDLALLVSGFNEMVRSLKHAYGRLEFHNNEMLTMLEHVKESVFFVNNYGRILSFNAAATRLIKKYLSIDRFKNRRINFFGNYVKDLFFSLVRDLQKSGKNHISKEVTFIHDGESKTFLIYLTLIKNAMRDENRGVLIVAEDLSEMYKLNKIKTWREAAKQMAHEIKNPLTPIQLATQRLQRKLRKQGNSDPALMDSTETILEQVQIIKGLVSHFSEFAKMPGTVIEQLDINKIIKKVVSLYEASYPDIEFVYDLQKYLPLLKADKKKLKRLIVNLLDNSVRALQKEKNKTITIRTGFRTNRNQIELLVIDNGPGISREVREKLFLPYVSSEKKNMGLGLAIVHDIVSQTGGSIKLLPSLQGATFQVLIPV